MNSLEAIVDYLANHPKLKAKTDFGVIRHEDGTATMTWTERTPPGFKVYSLGYLLAVENDRVVSYICDFPTRTFWYADPGFPGNLLRSISTKK